MMKKQVALFSTFLGWILASGLLATPPVQAQQWSPPVPTNLKVLPPDTAPRAVIGTMRGFAQGLGVRCQHCHVHKGDTPDDLMTFDFANDEKREKQTARVMLRMVMAINNEY